MPAVGRVTVASNEIVFAPSEAVTVSLPASNAPVTDAGLAGLSPSS